MSSFEGADGITESLLPPQGGDGGAGVAAGPGPFRQTPSRGDGLHRLTNRTEGESEVEQLARRVEEKRDSRIPVLPFVKEDILEEFERIQLRRGYEGEGDEAKVHLEDIEEWRRRVQAKVDRGSRLRRVGEMLGFPDRQKQVLNVLKRLCELVRHDKEGDDWFRYLEFVYYDHFVEQSRLPWRRYEHVNAAFALFFYYLFTPVWFCHIVVDRGVCPLDPTDRNRGYYGWVSALYFASTTISTVGYGDLSVEKDSPWKVFIGIVYMIIAIMTAVKVMGSVIDFAFEPFSGVKGKLFDYFEKKIFHQGSQYTSPPLASRIRRVKFLKLFDLTLQVLIVVLIGLFIGQAHDANWTWMTTFYWAVQTVTTIGYGDLGMSFRMRWFQIFYLILSTYFTGSVLGKLGALKGELERTKREFSWERREINRTLIEDARAHDGDDRVDQYEWVVASLLSLGKVSSGDIKPIMDKYRTLCGESGYIEMADIEDCRKAAREEGDGGDAEAGALGNL